MYRNLPQESLETIIAAAEKTVVADDRMLYRPFLEVIEKFADEYVIGGAAGIALASGEPLSKDLFMWEIHARGGFELAKKLAIAMSQARSPHIPAETVCLQTVLRHREFVITVYARPVVKIYSLGTYRETDLMKLMRPTSAAGFFGARVKILPPTVQLADVYRCLYTPERFDQWESAAAVEPRLWELATQVAGGRRRDSGARTDDPSANDPAVDKLVGKCGDVVYIGDFGVAKLVGDRSAAQRLHIIGAPDAVAKSAERVLGGHVSAARLQLNFPDDWQVTKWTLYWDRGGKKQAIADVYPAAEYEMIPVCRRQHNGAEIKVGAPWVVARFALIDNWSLGLAAAISGHNLDKKIRQNLESVAAVREFARTNPADTWGRDYVGVYVKQAVAKKKLVAASGERFHDWYPAREPK